MKKLLIVEDDVDLNSTIVKYLLMKSFQCDYVYDGEDALNRVYENHYDLILLDVKLPSLNGFEVAKKIREFSNVAIIFLTSLDTQKDIERGFENGADDYINKPFSLNELSLRINAILRRVYKNETSVKISSDIFFDTEKLILLQKDEKVHLTPKEIKLLTLFLQHRDKIIPREEIFELLYTYEEEPSEASLRVFINRLRNIIGKEKIETIKSVGYRYVS
jgi:DNA-binding response OmpR family regulator